MSAMSPERSRQLGQEREMRSQQNAMNSPRGGMMGGQRYSQVAAQQRGMGAPQGPMDSMGKGQPTWGTGGGIGPSGRGGGWGGMLGSAIGGMFGGGRGRFGQGGMGGMRGAIDAARGGMFGGGNQTTIRQDYPQGSPYGPGGFGQPGDMGPSGRFGGGMKPQVQGWDQQQNKMKQMYEQMMGGGGNQQPYRSDQEYMPRQGPGMQLSDMVKNSNYQQGADVGAMQQQGQQMGGAGGGIGPSAPAQERLRGQAGKEQRYQAILQARREGRDPYA